MERLVAEESLNIRVRHPGRRIAVSWCLGEICPPARVAAIEHVGTSATGAECRPTGRSIPVVRSCASCRSEHRQRQLELSARAICSVTLLGQEAVAAHCLIYRHASLSACLSLPKDNDGCRLDPMHAQALMAFDEVAELPHSTFTSRPLVEGLLCVYTCEIIGATSPSAQSIDCPSQTISGMVVSVTIKRRAFWPMGSRKTGATDYRTGEVCPQSVDPPRFLCPNYLHTYLTISLTMPGRVGLSRSPEGKTGGYLRRLG